MPVTAVALRLAIAAIRIVRKYERVVVFGLGRLRGGRGSALVVITPLLERTRVLNLQVDTADIPSQDLITKDPVAHHPGPGALRAAAGVPATHQLVHALGVGVTHHRRHPVVHRPMSGAGPEHALRHVFAKVLEVGVGELVAARGAGLQPLRDLPPGRDLIGQRGQRRGRGQRQDRGNERETWRTRTVMAATLQSAGSARIRGRHQRWRGAIRARTEGRENCSNRAHRRAPAGNLRPSAHSACQIGADVSVVIRASAEDGPQIAIFLSTRRAGPTPLDSRDLGVLSPEDAHD